MTVSAADAWTALGGDPPDRVDVLTQDRGTTVWRLHGVGDGGGAVIAKRSPRTTAAVERIVYEQCLREAGVPVLRYYGAVVEAEHGWLFVEEASGARFHPDKEAHRVAAARWLGALHRSIREGDAPPGLPTRRPEHYFELLRSQRAAPRDEPPDPALDTLAAQCDLLSACWHELEAACHDAPDTLVHGDIVAHNVCVREGPSGLEFLPFDWEKAGWGPAAEDISIADLEVYAAAVGTRRDPALERLAGAGRVFRCLVFLEWVRPTLADDREAALDQIRLCTSWIGHLMERAPWRP
ncbi:MAG: aminoglycoside phosphotransferase family protein [Planctomycetota bacterium]|jgi:hypothetical protein